MSLSLRGMAAGLIAALAVAMAMGGAARADDGCGPVPFTVTTSSAELEAQISQVAQQTVTATKAAAAAGASGSPITGTVVFSRTSASSLARDAIEMVFTAYLCKIGAAAPAGKPRASDLQKQLDLAVSVLFNPSSYDTGGFITSAAKTQLAAFNPSSAHSVTVAPQSISKAIGNPNFTTATSVTLAVKGVISRLAHLSPGSSDTLCAGLTRKVLETFPAGVFQVMAGLKAPVADYMTDSDYSTSDALLMIANLYGPVALAIQQQAAASTTAPDAADAASCLAPAASTTKTPG